MVSNLLQERWLRLAFAKDSTTVITEKKKDDPCWDNYEMVGTKEKDGKEVPNCVPINDGHLTETDETDEGNAFSGARQDAIDNDEDEFEVGGETFKVKGKKEKTEESLMRHLIRQELLREFDKDKMNCNKPRYLKKGETGYGKKQKVVKACKDGKEKIVKFGDANMKNKSSNKEARTNFRNRHKCSDKKDKMKAGYWACKDW